MADKEKPNVIALNDFRLRGVKVVEGEVVAKSDFASKGDWQNLANMRPARVEETDKPVGKPKAPAKAEMPAASK